MLYIGNCINIYVFSAYQPNVDYARIFWYTILLLRYGFKDVFQNIKCSVYLGTDCLQADGMYITFNIKYIREQYDMLEWKYNGLKMSNTLNSDVNTSFKIYITKSH